MFDRRLAETGKLDAGSRNERERVESWVPRIQEINSGKPDGADHYRPGYDPELTNQGQRLELMVRQLNDAGIRVGKRSVERYVAEYKDAGPAGRGCMEQGCGITRLSTRRRPPSSSLSHTRQYFQDLTTGM